MSLGAPVQPGEAFSMVYETVARRALRSAPGTLIVAAARTSPAPGPAVFSSVPYPFPASVQLQGPGRPWPARHHTVSGTSMATPHVAGLAALWLEAKGDGTTPAALWQLLTSNARRLTLANRNVGAGLAQAPV